MNIGYRFSLWNRDLGGLRVIFQLEMIYTFLIQSDSLTTSSNASAEIGLKQCLEADTTFASLLAAFKAHSQVALNSSSLIPTGRYASVISFAEDSEPV